uniref:Probable molybdopterin-synthase adenylyltransferase n=1 Tax=Compsopogon caeruleus TaxID=31354 RepID=A0A1Z1XB42_9RHOD|nr:molybdenum cofactor biosynthesis protein [Compsopogon caeruleus]ARX96075.1 molybdenum cofactor biosynthesis protein [Compsopogon caeruleus]
MMLNPRTTDIDLSLEEYKRYARHLTLTKFDANAQKKLKGAKVICIGAGGLSSPVVLYLSAAGVGEIGIVDNDIVDLSNLQRQIIFDTSDIDFIKVDAIKQKIYKLNPNCNVKVYRELLNKTNALHILCLYDIIIDCTDNFDVRYILNNIALSLHKPVVYGAVSQFNGQLSVFNYRGGPSYYDLYAQDIILTDIPSCSQIGILGPVVGIIGVLQSIEVIKIILGLGYVLSGKLLLYDALNLKFKYISIKKLKKFIILAPICNFSSKAINSILNNFNHIVDKISFANVLGLDKTYIIIDVRTIVEYNLAHIEGSINIPLSNMKKLTTLIFFLNNFFNDKNFIFYCCTQSRSLIAAMILLNYGIKSSYIDKGI